MAPCVWFFVDALPAANYLKAKGGGESGVALKDVIGFLKDSITQDELTAMSAFAIKVFHASVKCGDLVYVPPGFIACELACNANVYGLATWVISPATVLKERLTWFAEQKNTAVLADILKNM